MNRVASSLYERIRELQREQERGVPGTVASQERGYEIERLTNACAEIKSLEERAVPEGAFPACIWSRRDRGNPQVPWWSVFQAVGERGWWWTLITGDHTTGNDEPCDDWTDALRDVQAAIAAAEAEEDATPQSSP